MWGPATSAGLAYQAQLDKEFGPGQTIGHVFQWGKGGITGMSMFLGDTIFINHTKIGGNSLNNQAFLFHEALHLLGMLDTEIQEALGINGGWEEHEEHH